MTREPAISHQEADRLLRLGAYYLAEGLNHRAARAYARAASEPKHAVAALIGASDALAAEGDLSGARENLLDAVRRDARRAELYGRLARLALSEAAYPEADRWARKAEHLEPDAPGWIRLRILALHGAGRLEESLDLLARAIARRIDDVYIRMLYAQVLADAGRVREALGHADHAVAAAPANVDAFLARADLRARLGDADAALADYGRAVDLAPGCAVARLRRGQLLLDLGRHDEGFGDLRWVVEHFPDDERARLALAEGYWRDGQVRDALTAYDAALAAGVRSSGLLLGRAEALMSAGRAEEAEADCTRALELDPAAADAWAARGALRLRLGRFAEAERDLNRAVSLDGSVATPYAARGELRERTGDWPAAASDYAAALRIGGEDAGLRGRWVRAISRSGDEAGALRWLEKACRREPAVAAWWLLRGDLLSKAGRGGEARRSYARAADLTPDAAEPHLREAEHCERRGLWLEAVEAVNRALNIVPNDPVAYWMLANLHDRMGCPDLAAADRALASECRRDRDR